MRKQGISRIGGALLVLVVTLAMLSGCASWSGGEGESATAETGMKSPSPIPSLIEQPEPTTLVKPGSLVTMDLQLGKGSRYALVFGNGKYTKMPGLANPVNDATDIAEVLDQLGFTVTLVTDATLGTMDSTLRFFAAEIGKREASIALFFYAGHGAQFEGVNYLLPVDADIQQAHELSSKALSMELVASTLERTGSELNLVLLDACRDNPFASSRGSADRGLSAMVRGGTESMVVFATAPGAVAQDGQGRNSPFTAAFKEHLRTPDIEVRQLVARVSRSVQESTGSRQVPWVNTSFTGEFFFLTTEQLLASSRLGATQLQQQLMALDAEIAQRQQAIDTETDLMLKQGLELEQQRAKALEDAKKLEVVQLAEIQKQSLLSLSANKAELDRKQALETGMMQQQDALARQAEQKRKDLELLEQQKMRVNSPQSRLDLIASMEQAVKDIRTQYDRTIESTRTELASVKQVNVQSYKEVNPKDPWESNDDFNARVSGYERKLDAEHGAKIRGLEAEREAKIQAIGLEGAIHSIEGEQFTVSAKVEMVGFNADTKEFELLVSSKDPFVPLVATIRHKIAGKTREELQAAYTMVDNAQKANALTGEIVCSFQGAYQDIWKADAKSVVVKTLLEGTVGNPAVIFRAGSSTISTSNVIPYSASEGSMTRVYGVLPIRSSQGTVAVYSEGRLLGKADSTNTVYLVVKTPREAKGKTLTFEFVSTKKRSTASVEIKEGINEIYYAGFIYKVREIGPSGGYVFYDKGLYSDGWRYLEAAPDSVEWSDKVWGGSRTSVGGTGTAIGTGKSNTQRIVSKFGNAEPYRKKTDYAAKLCTDLVVSKDGVSYDDWFLPSKDELNQMYLNLKKNNIGGFSGNVYWSSSEYDYYYPAWNQDFSNGDQNNIYRNFEDRVRPVRAF